MKQIIAMILAKKIVRIGCTIIETNRFQRIGKRISYRMHLLNQRFL